MSTQTPDGATNNLGSHRHQEQVEDALEKIPNLFRLVDLVDEHGSDGSCKTSHCLWSVNVLISKLVKKAVIDQHSLHRLLNVVQPASHDSKIDFKALDNVAFSLLLNHIYVLIATQLSIKPIGLYGDRSEIVKYLQQAGCLDKNSCVLLVCRHDCCLKLLSYQCGPPLSDSDARRPSFHSSLWLVFGFAPGPSISGIFEDGLYHLLAGRYDMGWSGWFPCAEQSDDLHAAGAI
jgi:hypothetical protein